MAKPKATTKTKGYTASVNSATGRTTGVRTVASAKGKAYSPPAKPKFKASLTPAQQAALKADSARAGRVSGRSGPLSINGKFPLKGLGLTDNPLLIGKKARP